MSKKCNSFVIRNYLLINTYMETIFLYFGKMILVSAVMSAYYLLFLRDKTFHHYNRFYLLGTMVLSLLLPLLKVEYFTIETDSRILLLLNQFNQNSSQGKHRRNYLL